ncbi:MAG: hypothetical protein RLZZ253_1913 [Verrucomicrobiota bacterium]
MRLTLDAQESRALVGGLRGLAKTQQDITRPTTEPGDWRASL